jgi:hypothetical protein
MNKFSNRFIILSILLILFFVLIFGGWVLYSSTTNSKSSEQVFMNPVGLFQEVTQEKPKPLAINPLNGTEIFDEAISENLKRFPVAVMVNNALPARPQSGLMDADLIYEIVAEGGITRYLAIFLSKTPEIVGPIRSIREYYLPFVLENGNSSLMHIGYSPQALQKISQWDVFSIGLKGADFYRDNHENYSVATEHTAYSKGSDLFNFSQSLRGSTGDSIEMWKFKEDGVKDSKFQDAQTVQIDFWYPGDYTGYFKYDPKTNEYIRYSGVTKNGTPEILLDRETGKEVRVKNVIIQMALEFPIPNDDKNRLDYKVLGSGNVYVLQDGKVIKGVWKKDELKSRTKFYNENSDEIELNRGKIWVSVVPSRNENQVYFGEVVSKTKDSN